MFENALAMYTIYDSPSDHPGKFVVREHLVPGGVKGLTIHSSLEEARAAVPPGLYCIKRHPQDAPVVVETWF